MPRLGSEVGVLELRDELFLLFELKLMLRLGWIEEVVVLEHGAVKAVLVLIVVLIVVIFVLFIITAASFVVVVVVVLVVFVVVTIFVFVVVFVGITFMTRATSPLSRLSLFSILHEALHLTSIEEVDLILAKCCIVATIVIVEALTLP